MEVFQVIVTDQSDFNRVVHESMWDDHGKACACGATVQYEWDKKHADDPVAQGALEVAIRGFTLRG